MFKNTINAVRKFNAPVTTLADDYIKYIRTSLDRRFDIMDSLFGPWSVSNDLLDIDMGTRSSSTPPYDVHFIDGTYRIDVALAGFSKDQISVKVLEDKILQIVAEDKSVEEEPVENSVKNNVKVFHKKLSFSRKELRFSISKDSEIHDVTFENGLLTVNVTPPSKKIEQASKERLIKIE
jgi:molecular chaperone IbpA